MTSRVLVQFANQLRAGRHVIITGRVGDAVLLEGRVMSLTDALELIGRSAFDRVVRVDQADGYRVVYDRNANHSGETGGDEPIVRVRNDLEQSEHGSMVILGQPTIMLQDPAMHDEPDRDRVALLQVGMREAAWVGPYRNTAVLLAAEARRVPVELTAGIENTAVVHAAAASPAERRAYLAQLLPGMADAGELTEAERDGVLAALVRLSDGESLSYLGSLARFSAASGHSVREPRQLVLAHRHGRREEHWPHLLDGLPEIYTLLGQRVIGQDHAVAVAFSALAGCALGLRVGGAPGSQEGKPRGTLLCVGPTGVGKTELAKTMAEGLFGDPEAYFRIDCSTMGAQHEASRLVGAPPGYVGHEQGGELTAAVQRRPALVILLDEIGKAHVEVLRRLLSIIEDGRVTDGQGNLVYFDEAFIIMTSNIGAEELADRWAQGPVSAEEVYELLLDATERHFDALSLPEFLGRLDAVVPFDMLRRDVVTEITRKLISQTRMESGPLLDFDEASTCKMMLDRYETDGSFRRLGGRSVRRVLKQHADQLAVWIALNGHARAQRVEVTFDGDGAMWASVDGAADHRVTGWQPEL
jgi:hypothetical protein